MSVGDIDNDGDMDVLVVNLAGDAKLFFNESKKKGSFYLIRAKESKELGGRDAYGAVVELSFTSENGEKKKLIRNVNPGSSYGVSHDPRVHFGVPEKCIADSINVTWNDGTKESFKVDSERRDLTLTRGGGTKVE